MRAARVANCILGGAAAAVALFIARVLELGRALLAHGVSEPRLWIVAALGAALVLALLLAWRLPPPRRVNLALAVAAVGATLYAAELLLDHAALDPLRMREKLALIDALRAQGRAVSPGVEPVRFTWIRVPGMPTTVTVDGRAVLPLGGIARRLTVDCREGADWMTFETDEHGFHNPPGIWSAPALDVAFVGDSFVHGSCVGDSENMVARVRERHPATLGLGMAGSGPLAMLAEVREYLPALRPRIVVWCYFTGNDLLDLRRERTYPLLAAYLTAGHTQGLAAHQPALDRALTEFVDTSLLPHMRLLTRRRLDFRRAFALRELRARAGLALADPYVMAPTAEEIAFFARVLREARDTVQGWGGRLVFVYLPEWPVAVRQLGEREYVEGRAAAAARVRALVREQGLPLVDVEAAFQRDPQPERLYACPGCHYGPAGYALAARVILEAIDGGAP